MRLSGMVYAATKQSPTYGGSLKSFDFESIRNRPGVIAAVPMEGIGSASGIAVVADTWWHAKTALDALPVAWNPGPNVNQSSSDLFNQYRATLDRRGPTPVDEGDVEAALRRDEDSGSRIPAPPPSARADGTAELHRASDRRRGGGQNRNGGFTRIESSDSLLLRPRERGIRCDHENGGTAAGRICFARGLIRSST